MKIECDMCRELIEFEDGTVWEGINQYFWFKLMEIMLSPSQFDPTFETDFVGRISKKRYEAGKKYYEEQKLIWKL